MIKKLASKTLISFFLVFFLSSCKNDNTNLMPNVSGKAFEVLVIIEKSNWDKAAGELIKETLGEAIYGLPQSEPIFNLVQIPSAAFSNIFKTHRNIIRCFISDEHRSNKIKIGNNLYANSQVVIDIFAQNEQAFLEIFEQNSKDIIQRINEREQSRILKNYRNYEAIDVGRQLRQNHHIGLTIPRGYTFDANEKDFAWISHETPKSSQGILIYHYDYTDTKVFSKEELINTRNEFLKKYVPGPIENTYMTTEKNLPVQLFEYLKDGQYYAELRGLWELDGPDFMGGPFVNISTVDTLRNRVISIDAYVFAPQTDKRNYLRQLEAILSSLQILPIDYEAESKL